MGPCAALGSSVRLVPAQLHHLPRAMGGLTGQLQSFAPLSAATLYFFTTEQVSINSRQEFGPFLLVGLLKKSRNPGEGPSHPAQPLSRRRPVHPPENTDCDLSDVCFSRHIGHREGCAGRDSPAQTVPSSPVLSHSTPQTGGCRHGGDSESAFIFSILSEGERISARLRGDH